MRRFLLALAVAPLLGAIVSSNVNAQFEDEFAQGVIGTYRAADGTECRRIDPSLGFAWDERSPDPRLSEGAFRARWDGLLLSKTPGEYRLHAFVQGDVRVMLEGEVLLEGSTDEPQWVSGKGIPLKFDWHPLQVDFAKTSENAQLRLFWQGPDFPLEPISAEYFYHDIEKTFDDTFEHGRQLVAGYRCAACHTLDQMTETVAAPALGRLDGNISEPWLKEWLGAAPEGSDEPSAEAALRRMPHFDLPKDDVAAVVEFLLDQSQPRDKQKSLPPKGSVSGGRTLVMTVGCTACHQVGEVGNAGVMGGPSLTNIAEKRPQAFFREWLKDPAKLNPDHRMPVYDLSDKQRDDIAAYLATLTDAGGRAQTPVRPLNRQLVDRGRQVVSENRCFACHDMPGKPAESAMAKKTPLGPGNLWQEACLDQPNPETGGPAIDCHRKTGRQSSNLSARHRVPNASRSRGPRRPGY